MKSFLITGLLCSVLLLPSCRKAYCWQCTTTSGRPDSMQVIKKEDICDETEDEIKAYQLVNSYVTEVRKDSLIYTSTVCVRH